MVRRSAAERESEPTPDVPDTTEAEAKQDQAAEVDTTPPPAPTVYIA